MIDGGDGMVTPIGDPTDYVARKEHKCNECLRKIQPGEKYTRERFVWEGKAQTHKTCAHCMMARGWLHHNCGGWLYGAVEEDIREHAYENYGGYVKRLAVGMRWKWRAPSGRMLPVPVRAAEGNR
jgi:hypothetical protein